MTQLPKSVRVLATTNDGVTEVSPAQQIGWVDLSIGNDVLRVKLDGDGRYTVYAAQYDQDFDGVVLTTGLLHPTVEANVRLRNEKREKQIEYSNSDEALKVGTWAWHMEHMDNEGLFNWGEADGGHLNGAMKLAQFFRRLLRLEGKSNG